MPRDHYEVLGVGRDATADEVKKAYRRLARDLHPDANPGDPEAEGRFKEATAAYEALSDPERRARYDRFGHDGATSSIAGDPFGGLGDLFALPDHLAEIDSTPKEAADAMVDVILRGLVR